MLDDEIVRDLQEQVRGYRHGVGIAVSSLTALYLSEEQPLHLRLHAVTLIQEIRQAVGREIGRPDWESDFLISAAAEVATSRANKEGST